DHDCDNPAFRCDNGRCIDNSLKCNGFNSCGDMSDCRTTVSRAAVAGIVIGSLVGLFVLVAIACYFTCHCRHKHSDDKKKEGESQLVFVQGKTGPNTAVHRPGFAGHAVSELSCPGAAPCGSVENSKSLTAAKQPAYLPPWVEARKKSITGAIGTKKVSIKEERVTTGFDNPSYCGQGQSNSTFDEDECDQNDFNDIDVNVSKQCQGTNEQTGQWTMIGVQQLLMTDH
ncbi:hypothetical protein MAR_008503, partial [Mya arenaria]